MKTLLQEKIEQGTKELADAKEAKLLERVKLLDPWFDIEKEGNKRFPRLKCEVQNGQETWYWNNGEDDGFRIITFVAETVEDLMNDNRLMSLTGKMKFGFKYF